MLLHKQHYTYEKSSIITLMVSSGWEATHPAAPVTEQTVLISGNITRCNGVPFGRQQFSIMLHQME